MSESPTPRRSGNRFVAHLPARLKMNDREFSCQACDLSRAGVLLIGEFPAPATPEVEVVIETSSGDLRLHTLARVAHVHASETPDGMRLGLQFTGLTANQLEEVEKLVNRVMEGMAPAALDGIEPGMPLDRIRQALSEIPQPHRVALARRGQKREREILRHDRDGRVLEALARNPRLTAPEAIALARLPHLLPTTLAFLGEDQRWARNEELKVTVATHPRATFSTADRIIAQMGDLAVQRVLRRPGLNPGVREKLMIRLARKNRGA